MAELEHDDIQTTFLEAERDGIKLVIKGRFVAIAALGTCYLLTRSERMLEVLFAAGVLLLLGALHFLLVGFRFDRPWVKYAFISIDIVLLTSAIALTPEAADVGLPRIIVFRFGLFPFYFLVLAVAAFSFTPGMVAWAGVAGAAAWLTAFAWIAGGMERRPEGRDP